jgi:hypothetical protein
MFMSKRVWLIALLSMALPTVLVAQQRTPSALQQRQPAPAAQQAPHQQQVQRWMTELQELNTKLEAIQARAIQDPQLQSAQAALGAEIKAAMEKADPQLAMSMQRVEVLEAEATRAQQAGDQAKLQELAREAQGIQLRFMEAQEKVFQQPAIVAKVDAFQARLEARMVEVDPQTPALMKRFQELATALQAAQPR